MQPWKDSVRSRALTALQDTRTERWTVRQTDLLRDRQTDRWTSNQENINRTTNFSISSSSCSWKRDVARQVSAGPLPLLRDCENFCHPSSHPLPLDGLKDKSCNYPLSSFVIGHLITIHVSILPSTYPGGLKKRICFVIYLNQVTNSSFFFFTCTVM